MSEATWREDNTKLLQKMLRDNVERTFTRTGDSFLDAGKCPLCHKPVTIKQEAYSTVYTCYTQKCAIRRITVDLA